MAALQCEICGGKLIGRAGGIFECDSCGMQYDTSWAKEKIQQIQGTVKVEGTVEVTGTVKVDGGPNAESLLKRAELALGDEDWKTAETAYRDVLKMDPECAEAYFGLAMCDTELNSLEKMVQANQSDNKNFRRGKQFADSGLLARLEEIEQKHKTLQKKIKQASGLISAGDYYCAAVRGDGRVLVDGYWESDCEEIREWRDIAAVSTNGYFVLGLEKDGCVVANSGAEKYQETIYSWKKIKAISCGSRHILALNSNGRVLVAGDNESGQCDVKGWKNIVAIDAGVTHSVGLTTTGRVVATKYTGDYDYYGECDVDDWRGIVAVSAGASHTVGLRGDGKVVAIGDNAYGQCDVGDWKNVVSVSAGDENTVGLTAGGRVLIAGSEPGDVSNWRNIIAISSNGSRIMGLTVDGQVLAVGQVMNTKRNVDVSDWSLFEKPEVYLEKERELKKRQLEKEAKEKARRKSKTLKAIHSQCGISELTQEIEWLSGAIRKAQESIPQLNKELEALKFYEIGEKSRLTKKLKRLETEIIEKERLLCTAENDLEEAKGTYEEICENYSEWYEFGVRECSDSDDWQHFMEDLQPILKYLEEHPMEMFSAEEIRRIHPCKDLSLEIVTGFLEEVLHSGWIRRDTVKEKNYYQFFKSL